MTLKDRSKKYIDMTVTALETVKIAPPSQSFLSNAGKDFLDMCNNYLRDAKYFFEKADYENALAASSYAYAWLDAGVRLGILNASRDYVRFTQYS